MVFTEETLDKVRNFLGTEGIEFFRACKEEHGSLSPVLKIDNAGAIKYWPVEWNEGRQVRDFLLGFDEFKNEEIETLEKLWRFLVEQIIE